MAQQTLGRHNNQRPPQLSDHLPAEHVKKLSRGSRHTNLHVVVATKLQKAFEAGRGMFGALAFHAVWQKKRESAQSLPLGFTAADELIISLIHI